MQRQQLKVLADWFLRPNRKPLIIRGARQVGKSTLVKLFASQRGKRVVEVNLERYTDLQNTFASLKVDQILNALEALPNVGRIEEGTLVFLDEIQAVPQAITALRYFYEDRRDIPVVAAGSLFDFALADKRLSMPVGRVEYLQMVPMTFTEFLDATGEQQLARMVQNFDLAGEINDFAHLRLSDLLRDFSFVGGMPEAVQSYVSSRRFSQARRIHTAIIESFRDDFPKYMSSTRALRVVNVLNTAARCVGQKVKYVHYSRETTSRDIKSDIDHLCLARLISRVVHSHCNGIPLQAQEDPKAYKILFLDVGLMNTICGLDWNDSYQEFDTRLVNQGRVTEQIVGQHLLSLNVQSVSRELNYWLRERRSNNAEVNFVVAAGNHVVPIEVKSGSSGSLKSLHQFVAEKNVKLAVRFDTNRPTSHRIRTTVRVGQESVPVDYTLISLPLYLVESLQSIVKNWYELQ